MNCTFQLLGVPPAKLAYDRPSQKLLTFLSKKYDLNDAIMQPNRYAVFEPFFP